MKPFMSLATLTVLVLAIQGCAFVDAWVCREMGKPADCFVPDPLAGHAEAARVRSMTARAVELGAAAKFAESEALLRQALQIVETAVRPEIRDTLVVPILTQLAIVGSWQGRYAEAESFHRRVVAATEKARGRGSEDVANALHRLAFLYAKVFDRQDEAEPLLRRALAVTEQSMGSRHRAVAVSLAVPLATLGRFYAIQHRYREAEPLFRRALAIEEKTVGPEHPGVASTLSDLGHVVSAQRRYADAEALYRRALGILEKIFGREHPRLRRALTDLSRLYFDQGEYTRAEPLIRRQLANEERALGSDHVAVATPLNSLAFALHRAGRLAEARPLYERARRIHLAVSRVNADLDDEALRALQRSRDARLRDYAAALAAIAREPGLDTRPGSAALDAFVAVEHLRGGTTHSALARASARAAAADPATEALAREEQDLRNRWRALTRLSLEQRSEATQRAAEEVEVQLAAVSERLHREFPRYRELTAPEPIDPGGVQRLLRSDEALISFFALTDRLLVWLIRPGGAPVYRDIEIKKEELTRRVAGVRASLERLAPFDIESSHALYALLLAPFEERLTGVKSLIVVPDDLLLPLPFAALVTHAEGPSYAALADRHGSMRSLSPAELADYAPLPWLVRKYAVTVVPSATSLRTLRQFPRTPEADAEPLIAFGDPVLTGGRAIRGGAMLAVRGRTAVVDEIRKMDRLPGTRDELIAVAQALGADAGRALYLGPLATESTLRRLNTSGRLGKARVLLFATHGLMAGELTGLTQPALVLTPPEAPSEDDDGLLSLDEVLQLRLPNAAWVVLSACNTAAGDGSAESLTGLARAFLFAGARALLVSYWSVEDRATQALMTEVFRRYARDATLPRAEALRQAMLALMQRAEGRTAYFAHPFAWAPFFLVGEGGGGTD